MKRRKKPSRAAAADRHDLYQRAVQDAPFEVDFLVRRFRKLVGRDPISMREDFCGTALLSAEWVSSDRSGRRSATGIDLDEEVLAWGRERNVAPLGPHAARLRLLRDDVRRARGESYDLVAALNFSYWVLFEREELRRYFELVREDLARDGLLFLDAYGGWEGQEMKEDERDVGDGITYVWDQASFDPIHHEVHNHIHFRFDDGSALERAFSYHWRFWTLPELRELLREAGFAEPVVYWCEDDDRYRRRKHVQNQPAWLAYLVAKPAGAGRPA